MEEIRKLMNVDNADIDYVTELVYSIALTSSSVSKGSGTEKQSTLIAGNKRMIEQAEFSLDTLFCSLICPEKTETLVNKEEWGIKESFQNAVRRYWGIDRGAWLDIVTNMELAAAVASYAKENRTIHIESVDHYQHYQNFIRNIDVILGEVGKYLTDQDFSLVRDADNRRYVKENARIKEEELAHMLAKFTSIQEYRKPILNDDQQAKKTIRPVEPVTPTYARSDGTMKNFTNKLKDLSAYADVHIPPELYDEYMEEFNRLSSAAQERMDEFGEKEKVGSELSSRYSDLLKVLRNSQD